MVITKLIWHKCFDIYFLEDKILKAFYKKVILKSNSPQTKAAFQQLRIKSIKFAVKLAVLFGAYV